MTQHRYLPGDKKNHEIIHEILRVNHSGELGAMRIYSGQIAATNHRKKICKGSSNELLQTLKTMYLQEVPHYEYFDKYIQENKIRPSFFIPLWSILGYLAGYLTAVAGQSTAMMCTVGVEDVIGHHYQDQLNTLQQMIKHSKNNTALNSLYGKIEGFMYDELEHLNTGINHGAENMYGHFYFNILTKCITKLAISIAKCF